MTAESKYRVRDLCPGRQDWFARTVILFQERQSHCGTAFFLPSHHLQITRARRQERLFSYAVRRAFVERVRLDRLRLFFFIGAALALGHEAGGDEPNIVAALSMGNHDKAVLVGESDEEEPRLLGRVVRIGNGD